MIRFALVAVTVALSGAAVAQDTGSTSGTTYDPPAPTAMPDMAWPPADAMDRSTIASSGTGDSCGSDDSASDDDPVNPSQPGAAHDHPSPSCAGGAQ